MKKKDNWIIDYVDTLAIIDKNYYFIDTLRFNPRFDDIAAEKIYSSYINNNLFEVYPDLTKEESTIAQCIETGKIIIRKNQKFTDLHGNVFNTSNVTIPIIKRGNVVGAIELIKDHTSIDDEIKYNEKIKNNKKVSIHVNKEFKQTTFKDIITSNKEMRNNIKKSKIYSKTNNPILIYGETGTGKELFAQAIVNYGKRSNKKYITQNCAAIPKNLFESILFGAEEGAFTGAKKKKGLFEVADGGTLFLDEINSMPLYLQAKLLRVLENNEIRPVGSEKKKKVDVQIIAAMNIEPRKAIKNEFLRQDLFYRFSGETIELIPLRKRIEDIPIYIKEFIELFNDVYQKKVSNISSDLMNFFMDYKWDGNVRELKHVIQSMVSTADSEILDIKDLPIYMKKELYNADYSEDNKNIEKRKFNFPMSLNETVSRVETNLITKALAHTGGNITQAGKLLGVPRQTLKYKIDKYNIDLDNYK